VASTAPSGRAVEAAPEAAVCGALGCTERHPLYRVRHPSKGERVACEAHARRLAESIGPEAIPEGPKFNSGSPEESSSTGRTYSTVGIEETPEVKARREVPHVPLSRVGVEETSGVKDTPNTVLPRG